MKFGGGISLASLKDMLIDFRERRRERGSERERETSIGYLLYIPQLGTKPVPWWGMEPVTFWSVGWCSNQVSHTGWGEFFFFKTQFHYSHFFHTHPNTFGSFLSWPTGQELLDFEDLVGQFLAMKWFELIFPEVMVFAFHEHHIFKCGTHCASSSSDTRELDNIIPNCRWKIWGSEGWYKKSRIAV